MTKSAFFQITPLGGLGKIGGNSILVGNKTDGFLIDAGIEFPYENAFGIDNLVPAFDQYELPASIIITHGHEDHIGAIPFLAALVPEIIIYAPPFAASLIQHKLNQLKLSYKLITYHPFESIEVGSYKITLIPLPHSIPDTCGLLIQKDDSCCFYASDFKLNSEKPTIESLQQISSLSSRFSNRLLMADSTNVLEKSAPDDNLIKKNLRAAITSAKGRILVTCFSSNIERIEAISQIGIETKRKVIAYGKSMRNYIDTACQHDYLKDSHFTSSDSTDLTSPNAIILISGCQADFTSTLKRVASGEDPMIQPNQDDTFIYSAKVIPGNESQVSHLFDLLSLRNVEIITSHPNPIHTSGHASQEHLLQLYESFVPTHFIPVHGSHYLLQNHVSFLKKHSPSTQYTLLKNGQTFEGGSIVNDSNNIKPYFIQNRQVIATPTIKQRRKMASLGLVALSIKTESIRSRQLKFDFSLLGLSELSDENHQKLISIIERFFKKNKIKNLETTKRDLTAAVRIFFKEFYSIKPVIIIHFV